MLFGHDTAVALQGAAALVNTAPAPSGASGGRTREGLADLAALLDFVQVWSWSGAPPTTLGELQAVRDLRPRLRRWWSADEQTVAADVNTVFEHAGASPRVVRHGDYGWHVHALPDDAPLDQRMAVEAAVAVVDLLRAGDLARLKVCRASGCDHVLVDLTRNRSRHFCGSGCADRTHAAAYRARHAGDAG